MDTFVFDLIFDYMIVFNIIIITISVNLSTLKCIRLLTIGNDDDVEDAEGRVYTRNNQSLHIPDVSIMIQI
jgi:hypothetical protein